MKEEGDNERWRRKCKEKNGTEGCGERGEGIRGRWEMVEDMGGEGRKRQRKRRST